MCGRFRSPIESRDLWESNGMGPLPKDHSGTAPTASKDGHSRRCWRRAAANLGGHTVLRQVWHGRDQAWRLRRERPMLATPHREQPTCRRTGSRLQNNRPLPHPVKTVAARPGSVLSMVDTESAQFAGWAPSGVLTALANPNPPRWNGSVDCWRAPLLTSSGSTPMISHRHWCIFKSWEMANERATSGVTLRK